MAFSGSRSIPAGARLLGAVVANSPGRFRIAPHGRTRAAGFWAGRRLFSWLTRQAWGHHQRREE
jgi:hypothetical protein